MRGGFSGDELGDIRQERNFDLSQNTTYGAGGNADIAYFPQSEEEAVKVFESLINQNRKFFVLGRGSDILASDKGFDGCVISTKYLKSISYNGGVLTAQSGVTVASLLEFCKNFGLGGLEFLAGIPATVGGLAFMNGGALNSYIGDKIVSVTLYDGKLCKIPQKLCDFGYKHSTMRNINCLILSVELKVEQCESQKVASKIKKVLKLRSKQPKGRSCGCVFKNPRGGYAGKLIEECGLKGYKFGGAQVSEKHANFIINNNGSSDDIFRLISFVKRRVYEIKGVLLEEEVVYIGDFNETYG